MAFRNFPSPHCHSTASLDTASTPEQFAAWEAEHETGALTVTDHGTLAGARKVYDIATGKKFKGKLTPILGLESYFRDDDCPILAEAGIVKQHPLDANGEPQLDKPKSLAHYQKYYHLTMHAQDQAAYETMVRLLSFADERAERHGKETKPLFSWKQLEELGAQNITFTSSCLIGMVQRHLAFGQRYDLAEAYYRRLRSLVKPGNFYVEMFPHICDRNWTSVVIVKYLDGTEERFPTWKKLYTDQDSNKNGTKAEYLAERFQKSKGRNTKVITHLVAVMDNRKKVEREPKAIANIELVENFVMNECSAWSPNGDIQEPCNRFVIEMAQKYGDKILISDDSHFVHRDEKIVQDIKLMQSGNWRFHTSYHRLTSEDAWTYAKDVLKTDQKTFESWIDNGHEWASRFKGFKFQNRKSLPTSFYPEKTLEHTMALIQKHGRMNWRDAQYMERLRSEIDLLHYNGTLDLLPYFFIDEQVCSLYERYGELTGPGRGSAAGLLLAYLLNITHVDPLKYGLSRDRFLTLDRIQTGKLPDIDQDLPHRDLLVSPDPAEPQRGWLHRRFGDCVAQISTDITLKLRSAVLDVARIMSPDRRVPEDVAKLAQQFLNAPQGIEDRDFVFGYKDSDDAWVDGSMHPGHQNSDPALIEFIKRYPEQWEVVQKCLGVVRGKSRHACAYVIADEPIHNFIPLTSISGIKVTQPTAAQVESSGGLKMDFLVINSLKDIGACIQLIQDRSGDTSQDWKSARGLQGEGEDVKAPSMVINGKRVPLIRAIPHKGQYLDVWDLPEDQPVFRSICEGDTESVFQFATPGAVKWLRHFDHVRFTDKSGEVHKALDSIEALAAFTALDRPGPLDAYVQDPDTKTSHNMLVEFARRARGEKAIGSFPILNKLFPETYGILVYQEQLQKAFHELGETTAIEANNFRIHVSKKQPMELMKDKEIFMRGAVKNIGQEAASQLWDTMETFGAYGFNKSHAVCYVVLGYACAWLKKHYPLEWWTAVLRNADKNEIDEKFWRHCGHLIDMPDISLSGSTFEIVNDRIRAPLNLLHGLGEKAHEELCSYRPIKDVEDLCKKIQAHKAAGTKRVEKMKDGVLVASTQKGRSALNRGIIQTLIVSGAMDSLFPAETDVITQLNTFFLTNCQITGNVIKKTGAPKEKPDEIFYSASPITRFLMRKKVLPAYSENLLPLASKQDHLKNSFRGVGPQLHFFPEGKDSYPVARAADLQFFATMQIPRGKDVRVAAIGYVIDNEKKTYQEVRKRSVFLVDIEGTRWEWVKWPDKDKNELPSNFQQNFTGSICVFLLHKWDERRPFSIHDIIVVSPPLGKETEQSPESPEGETK